MEEGGWRKVELMSYEFFEALLRTTLITTLVLEGSIFAIYVGGQIAIFIWHPVLFWKACLVEFSGWEEGSMTQQIRQNDQTQSTEFLRLVERHIPAPFVLYRVIRQVLWKGDAIDIMPAGSNFWRRWRE